MKSRGRKNQRREQKEEMNAREDPQREGVSGKKFQVREKVGKSRFTVLWRKAHVQVNELKIPQIRSTFGS